jgi:DNA invertase Pin-like site-specific DNA recombinase
LLTLLDAGDVVKVMRLDRLGRSTHDLLNTLGTIADRGRIPIPTLSLASVRP